MRGLMEVNLSDATDSFHWEFSVIGVFLVKFMYTNLISTRIVQRSIHIWKIKVPLKIKVSVVC